MLVQECTHTSGVTQLVSKVHKMSWEQFDEFVDVLHGQMMHDPFIPSCIVGLARGGLSLDVALSHKFDVPMHAVTFQTRDGDQKDKFVCPENAVVVDDIMDTGETLTKFMADQHWSVRNVVLINKSELMYDVEYSAFESPYDEDG